MGPHSGLKEMSYHIFHNFVHETKYDDGEFFICEIMLELGSFGFGSISDFWIRGTDIVLQPTLHSPHRLHIPRT